MNGSPELDSFETALLTELRREVTEHPAAPPAPALAPRRSRRGLRIGAVAATGVAASVVAVFGLGGSGGTAAYAVAEDGNGDVTVTVHRLDDADGLENALQAKGIDADVSYADDGFSSLTLVNGGKPLPGDQLPPPPSGGKGEDLSTVDGGATSSQGDGTGAGSTQSGPAAASDPCGLGDDPATLTQRGSDWQLRIPADSLLQDRHLLIGIDSRGSLAVAYAGDDPNSLCGMISLTRVGPPA